MRRLLWAVLIGLFSVAGAWAAQTEWLAPGTPLLFADSAQSEDVTITLSALAAGAGRYSARYDKNALGLSVTVNGASVTAMPSHWRWSCHVQLTGTNVVGAPIEVYIIRSDGTDVDGNLGTSDAALASDKRRNLLFAGILTVDQTSSNTTMTGSGIVEIPTRYFSLGLWNGTTLPFKTDTAVHGCYLTPLYRVLQ